MSCIALSATLYHYSLPFVNLNFTRFNLELAFRLSTPFKMHLSSGFFVGLILVVVSARFLKSIDCP